MTGREILQQYVNDCNLKNYEIVEDTYEYDNGIRLIVYEDADCEIENYHICIEDKEY